MEDTARPPLSVGSDQGSAHMGPGDALVGLEQDPQRLADRLARYEAAYRSASTTADRLAHERQDLAEVNQEALACLQQVLAERELATAALFSVVSGRRLWRFLLALLVHPTAPITTVFLRQFPEVAEALRAGPT